MAVATFTGYGQDDSGGQAQPSIQAQTIVWSNAGGAGISFNAVDVPIGLRGPQNVGILYQTGGGGTTPGFGQIFPTGRS
jgi:hypothetical protein